MPKVWWKWPPVVAKSKTKKKRLMKINKRLTYCRPSWSHALKRKEIATPSTRYLYLAWVWLNGRRIAGTYNPCLAMSTPPWEMTAQLFHLRCWLAEVATLSTTSSVTAGTSTRYLVQVLEYVIVAYGYVLVACSTTNNSTWYLVPGTWIIHEYLIPPKLAGSKFEPRGSNFEMLVTGLRIRWFRWLTCNSMISLINMFVIRWFCWLTCNSMISLINL